MTSPRSASAGAPGPSAPGPNLTFRALRGSRSPGEFAAAVRRAAREIGEQVSCDARYIGRVESGEIRCPNYAYERVFLHMFPDRSLTDLGFTPRQAVRGRRGRATATPVPAAPVPWGVLGHPRRPGRPGEHGHPDSPDPPDRFGLQDGRATEEPEEPEVSDVLRRVFMTGTPAAMALLGPLGAFAPAAAAADAASAADAAGAAPGTAPNRAGAADAEALETAVRTIRLLDDQHGGDNLYRQAGESLRLAHGLLDAGAPRQAVSDRLHSGAGELAISVGWLAHDSGRFTDARSHYAEALATARMSGDAALEAHAFCNTAFLARDTGRPREALRAAQAAQQAARRLPSDRLRSLLALREAGGWAGLGDRRGCLEALGRAQALFGLGPSCDDPEWMTFFGEAELVGLEAQCWSALGEYGPAADAARRAVALQNPHFVRNTALFTAELAGNLAGCGEIDEAAHTALHSLHLLGRVRSTRITAMLTHTADALGDHRRNPEVAALLAALP